MKIYAATINHKHGTNLYLASSAEGRLAKIADYCRQWWCDLDQETVDQHADRTLSDEEVIDIYFAPENMGNHEWCELFEPEEVE